ncbi:hypothetical protein RMN57_17190 [Kitasatospora sp. CM 4170]|uniref:Uncharacterized protein n=1 Tax=Kitasatospora aburaviensis TaxID=67265 RepID=A0ABW1ETG0_9ACTN|nr:hypothetical protein [Kitasatospora sp. CM 4170]WNM46311.1 hypothetical protein RMN57_17190 [Kitasatospora sp. CM 4170]
MTIPPPPTEPPTAGMPGSDPEPVDEWWRKSGPRIPAPVQPEPDVHIPVPIDAGPAQAASMEDAAHAFWAPFGRILSEQASTITSQVGQLLTESEAQRAARQQVEYEDLLAAQRARMDSALGKVGETSNERAERHRVEDVLAPDRPTRQDDLVGFADLLAERISETPEDRAQRRESERELAKQRARALEDRERAAAGETPAQRDLRHRQQQLADRREARTRARRERRRAARAADPSDRAVRFRRWAILTAISAVGGYTTGLVSLIEPGGPYVGLLLAAAGWALDLHTRDRGRLRVSEVRGAGPLLVLVALRIPLASGLAVATGLSPLFAALPLF